MALETGTATRYDMKGLREDLADVIYDISPTQTPFMNMAGRGSCDQTLHEWQTDELESVDTANAQLEGDDASFDTPSASVRVGNYTQISRKTLVLSGTLEKVDKAGRKSELAYQIAKRGKEIKRDLESIALINQAGDAGGTSTARKIASLRAWLNTNTDLGSGGTTDGADSGHTSGVPSSAATDASSDSMRDFTETILKSVIQSVWTEGGEPKILMVGPHNKTVVSGFSGIATRNFDLSNVSPKPTAIIASADVYVSDFGTLRVIPNRFQRERDAWVLDPSLISFRYLRSFKVEKLAKTGDAEKRQMIVEWTLRVNQEAGLGLAADLNTS